MPKASIYVPPPRKRANQRAEKESRRARIVEVYENSDEEEEAPVPKPVELPFKDVPPVQFVPQVKDKNPDYLAEVAEEVAYRLKAPIDALKERALKEVMESLKKTNIAISLEELLALAPNVQKETKGLMTKKRVAPEKTDKVYFQDRLRATAAAPEEEIVWPDFDDPVAMQYVQVDAICTRELPFIEQFYIAPCADGMVLKGALVANDPVLQYLASVPQGVAPKQIFVAAADQLIGQASASLRVVFPMIHGRGIEESILDGGSQIVSMALESAVQLGLAWNPDITIFLQSANGQVEKTAGLARNVAFRFGELTIYLQVHVIKKPAYKVLLGRPFDILTASTVQNETNGNQTITLTDPTSNQRVSIPTFARGAKTTVLQKPRDTSVEIPEEPKEVLPESETNFQSSSRN